MKPILVWMVSFFVLCATMFGPVGAVAQSEQALPVENTDLNSDQQQESSEDSNPKPSNAEFSNDEILNKELSNTEETNEVSSSPEQELQPAARQSTSTRAEKTNTRGSNVVTMSAIVTGNQEQPKVMYIIPWQESDDLQLLYLPLYSQHNRIFGHVERSEHRREIKFMKDLEVTETSSQ